MPDQTPTQDAPVVVIQPKNQVRWITKVMRRVGIFVGTALVGLFVLAVYDQFIKEKPLYDTFETKEDARRKDAAIQDLKKLAENYQRLTIENTTALNSLSSKLDERHKDAQALHKTLIDDVTKNKVDIANIQFILGLKKTN